MKNALYNVGSLINNSYEPKGEGFLCLEMILDSLKNIVLQKKFRLLRAVPQARKANLPTCWHCVSIVTGAVGACNSWPFFATNIYDLFISNNHLRRGAFLS